MFAFLHTGSFSLSILCMWIRFLNEKLVLFSAFLRMHGELSCGSRMLFLDQKCSIDPETILKRRCLLVQTVRASKQRLQVDVRPPHGFTVNEATTLAPMLSARTWARKQVNQLAGAFA